METAIRRLATALKRGDYQPGRICETCSIGLALGEWPPVGRNYTQLGDDLPVQPASEGLAFLALPGDAQPFAGLVEGYADVDCGFRGACHAVHSPHSYANKCTNCALLGN
jgi:hypothetical protein